MAAIPSSVALTGIADGASIVAADHRNNYNAIQTFINALQAILAGGAAGQKLQSDGAAAISWQYPPGYEFAYVEFSATKTSTSTTFAGGTEVVSAGAVTFDGSTKVRVEFFAPAARSSSSSVNAVISLADGGVAGTDLGWMVETSTITNTPVYAVREFTPPAGTKTYSVVAWVSSAATATVVAAAGGAGTALPGFIRITKA